MITYYELLNDGTIGLSTPNEKVAKSLGLTLTTDKEIIYGFDGRRYFNGSKSKEINLTYAEQRILEYPPMADYFDAIVKINSGNDELIPEGEKQLKNYIEKCLAVKSKYPK